MINNIRSESFAHVDWQAVLDGIAKDIVPHLEQGKVASYIPALASVDPNKFGIAFTATAGQTFRAGDADTPFSIQSISKVFALVLALDLEGEELWKRVGREPSRSAFNSIVQLENEHGVPRNPFINTGAIVVTNTIVQHCADTAASTIDTAAAEADDCQALAKILAFFQKCAQEHGDDDDDNDRPSIRVNEELATSEKVYGDRNRALAYFMRSYGVVRVNVAGTLDTYFGQCALE